MRKSFQIVGVYNADGGIIGELTYVFQKFLGNKKCSLCSLTHESVFEKSEWKEFSSKYNIKTVHANEQF